jgi:hypothetical protein
MLIGQAVNDLFVRAQNIQRPEHQIPDRKYFAVILVVVLWVDRVVNVVLGGRYKDMFKHRPIAKPNMAVSQVRTKSIKHEISSVHRSNGKNFDFTHEQEQHQCLDGTNNYRVNQRTQDQKHRMVSIRGEWRHDFCGVMQRVERPKNGGLMVQAVRPVFAEIQCHNHNDSGQCQLCECQVNRRS